MIAEYLQIFFCQAPQFSGTKSANSNNNWVFKSGICRKIWPKSIIRSPEHKALQ